MGLFKRDKVVVKSIDELNDNDLCADMDRIYFGNE